MKYFYRLFYGTVLGLMLGWIVNFLGYESNSNIDSSPILRLLYPWIAGAFSYLLGAGFELIVREIKKV
jgi:hypothetical protein